MADIPDVDLSKVGSHKFGSFEVEVVDNTADYFATLKVRGLLRCMLHVARGRQRDLPAMYSMPWSWAALPLRLAAANGHAPSRTYTHI